MKMPCTKEKMLRWIRVHFGPEAAMEASDLGQSGEEWPRTRWDIYDGPSQTNLKPSVPRPALLASGTGDELFYRLNCLLREREYEAIARKIVAILREDVP